MSKSSPGLTPHPYKGLHCWRCRQQLHEAYLAAARGRRFRNFAAKQSLFNSLHFSLLERAAKKRPGDDRISAQRHNLPAAEDRPAYSTTTRADLGPERKLWASVFLVAMQDLSGVGARGRRNEDSRRRRLEAQKWVASLDDDVGSFVWVCDQIVGIDPTTARRRILDASREDLLRRLKHPEQRERLPGWNWATS